jgi:hypothetical protein
VSDFPSWRGLSWPSVFRKQMCAELGFRDEDLGSGMNRVVLDL